MENTAEDPFSRYKLPNLSRTALSNNRSWLKNIEELGKCLERDPIIILKWFSYETGSGCFVDKNGKFILTGNHPLSTLNTCLERFCKKFVICPTCSCYETDLKIKIRKKILYLKCKACGDLNEVDYSGKMTQFLARYANSEDEKKGGEPVTRNSV